MILKARQVGLTWIAVGYALWLLLFRPAATALLFSRRDDEAVHLLRFRLRGMYDRLPRFMQARSLVTDNDHEFRLSNGSAALAFPTTGGRSYTASLAIVDEADFTELDRLLDAVKPTIDAGGGLILLSTADKAHPGSTFKRIYGAAVRGENGYVPLFLPWQADPRRTDAWYAAVRADYLARDGTLDALHGEYPATDVEALAARSADRRFLPEWISRVADPATCPSAQRRGRSGGSPEAPPSLPGDVRPLRLAAEASLPGLTIFVPPQPAHHYVIGADPAEGNPQSDESAASVADVATGAQVAVLAGRFEPAVFAAHLRALSGLYADAPILVERNNHGHAVLLWLHEHRWDTPSHSVPLLCGWDGRPGWLSTGYGKVLAFNAAAEAMRAGQTRVRDRVTLEQLLSIEGATLRAPEGEHDDRAVAHVLALAAIAHCDVAIGRGGGFAIPASDAIAEADAADW